MLRRYPPPPHPAPVLTGPPRLTPLDAATLAPIGRERGLPMPYAAFASPVEASWADESVYAGGRAGRQTLREPRWRMRAAWAWDGLSSAQARLVQALVATPFGLTPRSRLPGDPIQAELLVPCRLVGDVADSAPLYRHGADGQPLYAVAVEAESVLTYAEPLRALAGGLVLVIPPEGQPAVPAGRARVEPFGTASLTTAPSSGTVVFMSQAYPAPRLVLGPPALGLSALRPIPGRPSALRLDVLLDLQLPEGP